MSSYKPLKSEKHNLKQKQQEEPTETLSLRCDGAKKWRLYAYVKKNSDDFLLQILSTADSVPAAGNEWIHNQLINQF